MGDMGYGLDNWIILQIRCYIMAIHIQQDRMLPVTLPNHQQTYNFIQTQPTTKSDSNLIKILKPNPHQLHAQFSPFHQAPQKRILIAPQYLPPEQITPTYSTEFIKQFQCISGSENLFPILLEIIGNSVYVCSKDSFIGFTIQEPSNYEKIKLPEMPTSFLAGKELLYFGLRSGTIIVYNIISKTTVATCEEFMFPVVQLAMVDEQRFMGMDLHGNLKVFQVSIRTVLDRVVKVSISANDIIQKYRVKKREKLKNFVKSLPFRKQKPEPLQSPQQNNSSVPQVQHIPKFCLLPQHLRTSSTYPMIYYYKGSLSCLILDQKLNKISEQIVLENVGGKIGMMELGEGGFSNSNQSHTILVVSIENVVQFYRQLAVQNSIQYIKISEINHASNILTGKFLSNNLLLFLTQQGVELSNINDKILPLQKIGFEKFSYIDFFNEEQGFNFDKRLLYRNVIKIGEYDNGDCMWCCLQGKRLAIGKVYSWQNYLLTMADSYQWQKCLKSALMIYKDSITLLGNIPQRLEQRNQSMQTLFQKITLTYLSYSLKNTNNPLEYGQIVRNVIDFMIRTECFTYLFTTLYEAIKGSGLDDLFFMELQEYVESGSIKWMTDEILDKVVKYYTDISKKQFKPQPIVQQQHQHELIPSEQQPNSNTLTIPNLSNSPTKSQQQIQQQFTLTQNRHHLQTMIMNFDLAKMQKSSLLSICLNNELYRALIYICREQGDYVTPVIKLCGLRFVKADQLSKLQTTITKDQITNINSTTLQKIRHLQQQLSKLTSITFFYLTQCLLGHNTEHNNTKSYLQMLQQLISFIFIPSSLLMLLQASPNHTFEVLEMICGVQVMQHVLENGSQLGVKKCRVVKQDEDRGVYWELAVCLCRYVQHKQVQGILDVGQYYSIFTSNSSEQFKIYNEMLSIVAYTVLDYYIKNHPNNPIIQLSSQIQQQQNRINTQQTLVKKTQKQQSQIYLYQFHNFVTHLILNNSFPLRLGWRVLAYQYCLMYPKSLIKNTLQINQTNTHQLNLIMMRIIDSIIRQVSRTEVAVDVLQGNMRIVLGFLLAPLQKNNDGEFIRYYEYFVPIKCYILDMLEQSNQIIETLLGSGSENTRRSVFKYIGHKIDSFLDTLNNPSSPTQPRQSYQSKQPTYSLLRQKNLLSFIILQKLHQLLKLSQTETLQLITKICTKLISINSIHIQQLLGIADKLRQYPESELYFIETVIGGYESILHLSGGEYEYSNLGAIGKNMEMLAVRHLMVVVQYCPDKLSENILKIHYPLEQAYKVCEQFNNKTAMAFVLIKSGRNQQGVLLICDLFSLNCRQVFRNLAKNTESQNTALQMQKMNEQLSKILQTCCNEYINDITKGEELFQKVLEKLFKDLNPKVIDNIPIIKIRELLQQYINKIITMTFSLVNPEFFIEKFSKNSKMITIPTRLYVQAYNLVCSRLGFNFQINFITKELLRDGEMKIFKNIVKNNTKGLAIEVNNRCDKCQLQLFPNSNSLKKQDEPIAQYIQPKQQQPVQIYNCGHQFHYSCLSSLQSVPQPQKQKQKPATKSQPSKKNKITNFCPNCKNSWNNIIYQQLQIEADRYSLGRRQRKKSILIERKNKLTQFDAYDWYGVKGEVYGKHGERVF